MEDGDQPTMVFGAKREGRPASDERTVATPLGEGRLRQPFMIERHEEWGWEAEDLSWASRFGRAEVSFHVDGRDGDPFPTSLRLAVCGGSLDWGSPRGEPATRGDKRVAWSVHARLDLASGLFLPGKAPVVTLCDFDRRGEGFLNDMFQASLQDVAFEAEVASEVALLVEGWAAADRGYAARIYAALLKAEAENLETEVEAARLAFLRICDRRGRAACAARTAEIMVRSPGMPVTVLGVAEGDRPHAEIRGFGGEPLDARNVDEVLAWAPESIHVETMSEAHTWMGVYLSDGRRLAVTFGIVKGELKVTAEIDDDGLD